MASSRSSASSDGSSSSSTESSSEEERKHKKRDKEKKSKKKTHRKDKKSKKSHKSRKDKKKKKDRSKDKEKPLASTSTYGKYGIIRESDLFMKREEFELWLREVKSTSTEMMSHYEERKFYAEYMEDYNTATLPHKKYYNLQAYEAKKAGKSDVKRSNKRSSAEANLNDEELRKLEIKRMRDERKLKEVQDAYSAMDREKVVAMREQEQLRAQMQHHWRTGNIEEALKIQERLAPSQTGNTVSMPLGAAAVPTSAADE
eukprot:GILK01005585.1.p1 GENE.GILK01005585.1~~GILK01005585.1.p1  ORF type:complete len:268 (-),score=66.77 GILK01005585.1:79-852(-)